MRPAFYINQILIKMTSMGFKDILPTDQSEDNGTNGIQTIKQEQANIFQFLSLKYKKQKEKDNYKCHTYTTDIPCKAFCLFPEIKEIEYQQRDYNYNQPFA